MRFPTRRFSRHARGLGYHAIHAGKDGVHALAELHVLMPGTLRVLGTGKFRVGPFADAFKIDSAHRSCLIDWVKKPLSTISLNVFRGVGAGEYLNRRRPVDELDADASNAF